MENKMSKEEWIAKVSSLIADTMETEMEFNQRKRHEKLKGIKLEVLSEPAEEPMLSFKPTRFEKTETTFMVGYRYRNDQINFWIYEKNMAKGSKRNHQLRVAMSKVEDYKPLIIAFLENTIE